MSFPSAAKRFGKKIGVNPKETVPYISVKDWFRPHTGDPKGKVVHYLSSLFPILKWITRYNFGWFAADLIAGITVGLVIVPQGMSYALLATLPPEYGLYSSFVGVTIYCFFATSKDVSIGPVAVMSLTLSHIIRDVTQHYGKLYSGPQIGVTLSFLCGFIALGIGLLRLGWIVNFISSPAISGFMTGSAITIIASQLPGLMGITGFDSRGEAYKVIINTLKGLPRTKLDAAFGLVGLFFLYAIRITCDALGRRYPRRQRLFFFISVLRNAFVLLVLTVAAWLYARHRKTKAGYPIKILQTVPRGLKQVHQPRIDSKVLRAVAPKLPVATIILLLEHIAIAISFGRVNHYKIDPNQELVAIGVTNTIGSCFGAYPATGSFSRTALKSKCGVKTPIAGVFTAVVVLVALYGLTPAFFWIPTAGVSAVVIHAVADLVAPPSQVYSYWRVSPLEFVIWAAAVLVAVFSTIENSIYTSIIASLVLLLIRTAHPRGNFLGRIAVSDKSTKQTRDIFVPLDDNSVISPNVKVCPPSSGVLIYRLEESFVYPSCKTVDSVLVEYVRANIKRGKDMSNVKPSDRAWNDPGPRRGAPPDHRNDTLPDLHAIVLDFSAIPQVDTTGVQALIDTRNQIERWVDHPVEFHFATIMSPWIRRALIAGGFGIPLDGMNPLDITNVVPYSTDYTEFERVSTGDTESAAPKAPRPPIEEPSSNSDAVVSPDTPFFHIDLASAVRAAERANGSSSPVIDKRSYAVDSSPLVLEKKT